MSLWHHHQRDRSRHPAAPAYLYLSATGVQINKQYSIATAAGDAESPKMPHYSLYIKVKRHGRRWWRRRNQEARGHRLLAAPLHQSRSAASAVLRKYAVPERKKRNRDTIALSGGRNKRACRNREKKSRQNSKSKAPALLPPGNAERNQPSRNRHRQTQSEPAARCPARAARAAEEAKSGAPVRRGGQAGAGAGARKKRACAREIGGRIERGMKCIKYARTSARIGAVYYRVRRSRHPKRRAM